MLKELMGVRPKDVVLTEPSELFINVAKSVIDFNGQTVILRDNGRFLISGTSAANDRRARHIRVKNLHIVDERLATDIACFTFSWTSNCSLEDCTINGRRGNNVCLELINTWDFELKSVNMTNSGQGLKITDNCNGVIMCCSNIEKMNKESIYASQSRNLVFDITNKIHGFGHKEIEQHNVPRIVAKFIDCGSTYFQIRLMHCVPLPNDGLVYWEGPKTEKIVAMPLVLRSKEGPCCVVKNAPRNLEIVIQEINQRRPSLVDGGKQ
jgi:hypothetical protein